MRCSLQLILATAGAALALAVTTTGAAASAYTTNAPAAIVTAATSATRRCFPAAFMFGSATAAAQVEGGWNETGRTPSIWDDFCRERQDVQCANVASDFVHRYHDDIQLMVASGLDSFRFSISWSRVMHWDATTRTMAPNALGIAFYHAVLDELRCNGITPILTLYHGDLPSELHTELTPRGWLNRDIVDHFVAFAGLMFREYGAKVDLWATFNEPWTFVTQGYGNGMAAPGLKDSTTNMYTAAHNVLLAHATAVQHFRALQASGTIDSAARVSIVLNGDFAVPLNASDRMDAAAAARRLQFQLGWFLSPIVSGTYPDVMRARVDDRLPVFTTDEAALVKGSYDLFMLNHYATKAVVDCESPRSTVKCSAQTLGWERDLGIDDSRAPPGARLSSTNDLGEPNCKWFTGYPVGYLSTIEWLHAHDPRADILLTENGWCGNDTVDNLDQLWYFQTYLNEVYRAITEFEIPVIGYMAWSFVDNFEWGSYTPRFGLYYVNFTAQTGQRDEVTPSRDALARIPRTAAKWYAQVAKTKCLEVADTEVADHHRLAVADYATFKTSASGMQTSEIESSSSSLPSASSLFVCVVLAVALVATWTMKHSALCHAARDVNEATPLIVTN